MLAMFVAALLVAVALSYRAIDRWLLVRELKAHAAAADRIVVDPSTGRCKKVIVDPEVPGGERVVTPPVIEIRGKDKVTEVLGLIEVSGFRPKCYCAGDEFFLFYRGDALILKLGYHHGEALRWHEGKWPGDAVLTAKAQAALDAWLSDNGYPHAREARQAHAEMQRRESEEAARFASFFPEQARGLLSDDRGPLISKIVLGDEDAALPIEGEPEDERAGRRIAELVGEPQAVALPVCQALGVTARPWNCTGPRERRALIAIDTLPRQDFHAALRAMGTNRLALLGAARLVFRHDYLSAMPKLERDEWILRIARVVLADSEIPEDRSFLIKRLRRSDDPRAKELLQGAANRK